MIVVVIEVARKAYLASLVPVIVNAVLNEHQVVVDIVAFVSHGDFPRSRLGEKQRGKVLASWVTRKLRTLAQFSIREMEGSNFASGPQHRMSKSSKPGSIMGQSTRRSTIVPDDTAPRSPAPAPVLMEHSEEPSLTLVNSASATISEVPQITEPTFQPETPYSSNGTPYVSNEPPYIPSDPPRGHGRDLSFDFGDFGTTAPSQPNIPAETLPYRGGPEHYQNSYMGGQGFPQRSDSYNNGPGGAYNENGDWPQEALMYQSAFDTDARGQQGPTPARKPLL